MLVWNWCDKRQFRLTVKKHGGGSVMILAMQLEFPFIIFSFFFSLFWMEVMQCSSAMDILFLMDSSYSMGKGSFERSKHFAVKLSQALDIGPDKV